MTTLEKAMATALAENIDRGIVQKGKTMTGLEMTEEELIAFEADIAREFNAGNIHAPVHLSGGNEQQLIDIFREVKSTDWVCSTHRSHYHALLKGIPPAEVKRQIMAGRSMFISSPEHRFISSAIVGGMLPIACGLAYAGERVWCFVGDMARCTGAWILPASNSAAMSASNAMRSAAFIYLSDAGSRRKSFLGRDIRSTR